MKFFIDSADIDELRRVNETGLLDGVTTNPSLVAKAGKDFKQAVTEICSFVEGPVSAEVAATDYDTMIKEGETLAGLADNVCVKVPLTVDGLKACRHLRARGTMVNVTLCFSASQALLAAKAGATYISPFIGRLDDINLPGIDLIADIRQIYDTYAFTTEVLAASIRGMNHVSDAALAGADVATIPAAVFWKLYDHPLTDKGLDAFVRDWKSTGQSIL